MLYKKLVIEYFDVFKEYILIDLDNDSFESFTAEIGNPNYDDFLTQAELTDKQVHALKPDVWFDFPNGDK